ncbi:hypothetical protein GGI20_006062, partial [Coemansia sp. BCRC 34301]
MDSEEATFVLCSIDSLTHENRLLQERLAAVEQSTRAQSNCSTYAVRNVLTNNDNDDDDFVEPLTTKHLDEVMRGIGGLSSTWADLRQVYPPRQSGFAPVHSASAQLTDRRLTGARRGVQPDGDNGG